jgi:hypothetical protein
MSIHDESAGCVCAHRGESSWTRAYLTSWPYAITARHECACAVIEFHLSQTDIRIRRKHMVDHQSECACARLENWFVHIDIRIRRKHMADHQNAYACAQ